MKAQEILDRVIGTDRLPTLKDRENPELRYLDYVVEEAIRWRPLSPIGIYSHHLKTVLADDLLRHSSQIFKR